MTDIPKIPEESSEGFLKEIEEGTIISNLELLRMKFVGTKPDDPQDEKTKLSLLGIQDKGVQGIENGAQHSITITYNTRTGEILASTGRQFGDFSILRTDLIEKGDIIPKLVDGVWVKPENIQRVILLYKGGNMPTSWEYDEALSGIETGPATGTRRIMPERLSPEHPTLKGINEIWGQSEFVDSAKGDLVMLKTIRKFNEIYGPPK